MAARANWDFVGLGQRTMLRVGYLALAVLCVANAIGAIALPSLAYAGHLLITEGEARLPPPKGTIVANWRGITRGPKIEVIGNGELSHSALHLQLKFESFGGSKIDPDSVRVTYLKTPNVDLTERIKSFVRASGIDMPDAQLPPGDHMIRVDVRDSEGRMGSTTFVLKISP
jgi:hypothetical protein